MQKIKALMEAIQQSKEILNLKDDWDDEGAIACNSLVYDRAINFLVQYVAHIYTMSIVSIDTPEINLCKDGSIDLQWRAKSASLLVNIHNKPDFEVHFFGESADLDVTVGDISINQKIDEPLALWMTKHLNSALP